MNTYDIQDQEQALNSINITQNISKQNKISDIILSKKSSNASIAINSENIDYKKTNGKSPKISKE